MVRERFRRVWYLAVGVFALVVGMFYHQTNWSTVTLGSAFETLLAFLVILVIGHLVYEFVLERR